MSSIVISQHHFLTPSQKPTEEADIINTCLSLDLEGDLSLGMVLGFPPPASLSRPRL